MIATGGYAAAQNAGTYSPAAAVDHPTHVFWGDTHVHTSFSSGDANMVGTNDADPSIAYRFARGDVVEGRTGMPVRLRRPLDFLVIADHAENLGVSFSVQSGDPALLAEEIGRQLREAWLEVRNRLGTDTERRAFNSQVSATGRAVSAPYRQTVCQRVVVFRDDPSKTGTIVPFSAFDSRNPEDLWRFLARYEQTTGGQVLAIPHNGNTSNGEMFGLENFEGEALTATYSRSPRRPACWSPWSAPGRRRSTGNLGFGLRREVLRRRGSAGGDPQDHAAARLHVADLVHARVAAGRPTQRTALHGKASRSNLVAKGEPSGCR